MTPMTKRETLLKKLSTYQFAAHDLQLYLDTHPDDEETLEKMNRFKQQAKVLASEYEEQFGPLRKGVSEGNMWSWIKSPWPWENEEDC